MRLPLESEKCECRFKTVRVQSCQIAIYILTRGLVYYTYVHTTRTVPRDVMICPLPTVPVQVLPILPAAYCLLLQYCATVQPTVLPTAYCLLPTAYILLPAACCLLPENATVETYILNHKCKTRRTVRF